MRAFYVQVVLTLSLCLNEAGIIAFLPRAPVSSSGRRRSWISARDRNQRFDTTTLKSGDGGEEATFGKQLKVEKANLRETKSTLMRSDQIIYNGRQSLDTRSRTQESCNTIIDKLGFEALEIVPTVTKDCNGFTKSNRVSKPREKRNFISKFKIITKALEKTNGYFSKSGIKNGMKKPLDEASYRIRLQAGPCDDIQSLDASGILRKIEEAKRHQSKFRKADLYDRKWVKVNAVDANLGESEVPGSIFTVMQFNTLAEGLSSGPKSETPFKPTKRVDNKDTKLNSSRENEPPQDNRDYYGGFTEVPLPDVCLDFALRRWRLLEVILKIPALEGSDKINEICTLQGTGSGQLKSYGPDILAMEEVDRYSGFFQPALEQFGYSGLFVAKPNAPGIPLGWYSDGCALFWKSEIFDLVSDVRRNFKEGGQVYIVSTLRHRVSGRYVVAAVTHLKAQRGKDQEKRRTKQARELLNAVRNATIHAAATENAEKAELATESKQSSFLHSSEVPFFIMGDFNTEPYGQCRTCISNFTADESMMPKSAYPLVEQQSSADCSSSAIPFTTWKTRGEKTTKHVIDYIFHNCPDNSDSNDNEFISERARPKSIQCTHILGVPNEDEIDPERLPSFRYPSDHIMLASKFFIQ